MSIIRILAIDDEKFALNILTRAIREAMPNDELISFHFPDEALKELENHSFHLDIAFLDIEMPGSSGLEVAAMLKKKYPLINIIFVTGHSSYALEAFELRPSGYVLKPVTKEKILAEIENLRISPAPPSTVYAQCFGKFDIFYRGVPIQFSRAKSKEMLAYLIDRRGASCSSAEIAGVLWEDGLYDRSRQKQLSVIRLELIKSLKQIGAEYIITKINDGLSINIHKLDCDYYRTLNGDEAAINTFIGEYMSSYSWAETTNAALTSRFNPK